MDEVSTTAELQQPADVNDQLNEIANNVAQLIGAIKAIQTQLKQAQKDVVKMSKENAKKKNVSARKASQGNTANDGDASRKPSGFDKPTLLADQMCDFLGLPSGTKMGRTDVTRRLTAYIKENNLQDAKDKRQIWPDDRLKAILSISNDEVLTFFNIQRYIKHNFVKDA
jgi:chromatin remodeling complex protein RSC6